MKKIISIVSIISLLSCTTQKEACELDVKKGVDAMACEETFLYLAIGSTYKTEDGKRNLFNDLGNFQLLRCLRYTVDLRACKDESIIIPEFYNR